MPFTISHAVLAPPLSRLSGNRLPIAALAIGCMTPDLYRLFTSKHYFEPHQWNSIFSVTLWIGLTFCLIWYALYRPVLYRTLSLKDPIRIRTFKEFFIFLFMIIIAILLGICTHLAWDGVTHVDFRTFMFKELLSTNINMLHYNLPLHLILQIGSSFLALPFIYQMTLKYLKKYQSPIKNSKKALYWGTGIFMVSLGVGFFSLIDYLRYIPSQSIIDGLYHIIGKSFNEFSQGFLITISLGCLLFLFLDRDHRLG